MWPDIEADPATDDRTRDLAHWLNTVEKVVVSHTLQDATWANSRIARDLEAEDSALKAAPGRDILMPDGLPPSRWELGSTATLSHGAVAIHYRRSTG